jgi:hypothetical protein
MKQISAGTSIITIASLLALGVSPGTFASRSKHPSDAQLRACRDAVQEQSEYRDLPNAAFSVYPGTHEHGNVDWSVVWDGLQAHGTCKVKDSGTVKHVKTLGSKGKNQKHKTGAGGYDGFYYDRHQGKWRDPEGNVCYTCTPENGFPNHGATDKQWRPKNKYERNMQKQLNNSLSDEDIRNLNSLL